MRSAKDFFKPLAIGAPEPLREIPFRPSRMIHFFDPSNPKMASKVPELARQCDVLLGNLEDAIAADKKVEAREGLVRIAREVSFGKCQLWTRVNSLDSPWMLDDIIRIVTEIGDKLDVVMIPKVEGAGDIHYVDRLLAQLEAKARLKKPLLLHAILETPTGVANVEEICGGEPAHAGPVARARRSRRIEAHEDDAGGRRASRIPGAHRSGSRRPEQAPRPTAQQDLWHYTMARMVDACTANGILPYYGPFGDIKDTVACEDQFRNAFLMGCVGAWSLHPVQIEIAKRVFSPPAAEVLWAKKVIAAMGDGTGAVMLDGKMQDDATFKQCRVMVDLAKRLAEEDPELARAYEFDQGEARR